MKCCKTVGLLGLEMRRASVTLDTCSSHLRAFSSSQDKLEGLPSTLGGPDCERMTCLSSCSVTTATASSIRPEWEHWRESGNRPMSVMVWCTKVRCKREGEPSYWLLPPSGRIEFRSRRNSEFETSIPLYSYIYIFILVLTRYKKGSSSIHVNIGR